MLVAKHFTRFFTDFPPSFPSDDTTKVKVNGKLYNYTEAGSVDKLFPPEVVLGYELTEWYKLSPEDKVTFVKNFIEGTFRPELRERAARKALIHEKIKDSPLLLPDTNYILENLQPARIIGDARKEAGFSFIDRKTGKITEYDYHSIFFALARDIDEKTIKVFMTNIAHIKTLYEPHKEYKMELIEDSNNIYAINQYVKPHWALAYADAEPRLDEDLEQFLLHLFPKLECLEFVFNWVYHSLTSRAGTYLYLCGGQGSGKNTFARMMTNLHGSHNSSSPKQDALHNRFNFYLKEKRFVFFDEFNCRGRRDKDLLKAIINDRTQIEGKGRDQEEIEIHASYVIANNSLEAIGLDPIDRRFSVPDITHDNIVEVYGHEWMRGLLEKIECEKTISQFAAYVLHNYKDYKYFSEDAYQKTRYEEIVRATARLGLADTLGRVLQGDQEEYDYYEESEIFMRIHKGQRYPSIQDWQTFFKTIKVGGKKIGDIIEGRVFRPVAKFTPGADARGDLV